MFAIAQQDIVKSTDAGATWETVEIPSGQDFLENLPSGRGRRDGRIVQQRAVHPRSRRRDRHHSPRGVPLVEAGSQSGTRRERSARPRRRSGRRSRPTGARDHIRRTRMTRRRVLVVHTRMPAFDRDRGSQEIDNSIRFLLDAGWQVTFLAAKAKASPRSVTRSGSAIWGLRPTPGSTGRSGCCGRTASTSRSSRSGSWGRCSFRSSASTHRTRASSSTRSTCTSCGWQGARSCRARSSMPRTAMRPHASSTPTAVPTR